VQFDEMTNDRETQSHPARASSWFALPESLEYVRKEIRIDAGARVSDFHAKAVGRIRQRDGDMAARGRKLDGIRKQVPHDLFEPDGVTADR